MRITRLIGTSGLLAAAVAGIVAVAGPATATPPWVVTVGAQTTGQVAFSAYTKAAIQFVVAGPSGPFAWSCGQAAAAGVVFPASHPTGLAVAKIEGVAWSKCVGLGGLALNFQHFPGSKWNLNLTGTDGPSWAGYINQINGRLASKVVSSGGIPVCAFTLTGRMNAIFNTAQVAGNNSSTQTLTINQPNTTPNLVVSGVSGCFGTIANGNSASFTGSFKVYNPVGLIGIS